MEMKPLFPVAAAQKKWSKFSSVGYGKDVHGVICRAGEMKCGLAVGGMATGAIDLDTDGTLGRCTCFNSIIPPRELGAAPFLTLAVDDGVWALAKKAIKGAKSATEVYYWGHYPIADLQYETGCPVDAQLRAWSPFIPGDAAISNTPAIVCELTLTNDGDSEKTGSVVMTFPGPTHEESGTEAYSRRVIEQDSLCGVEIGTGEGTGFVLAALGDEVRTGAELSPDDGSFGTIRKELPTAADGTTGASIAVDFQLRPAETKTVRFVLAWYYPILHGINSHAYLHAYGPRFKDATAVAEMVARNHQSLLERVIAWQEVIYGEEALPDWLRDCLINTLYLLAEDAFWEANSIPEEDWARETGMFSMVESTRTCPGQSCIPSDFYGNFPVVYFFPELALSTLRGFANLQRPNGEIPIYWGQNYERQNPVYQLLHVTSPCNYVDIVDRLWLRTSDDAIVHELFPSVKRAVEYLQSLDKDADGLLDCHPGPTCGHQFYGGWFWKGAAVHVVGMWLSVLRIAERMAAKVHDHVFEKDCRVWLNLAERSLEEKLWNGDYYLLYNDTQTGEKSETILSNQLCGQWCARLHGTDGVFPTERIEKVLDLVRQKCVPPAKWGAVGAVRPDGSKDFCGGETSEGTFVPENMILAMTMMYEGDYETGLKIAHENMYNLVLEQGLTWDLPNTVTWEGEWLHGNDFDQLMIVWSLPAALGGQSLAEFSAEGGLVDRIIQAGNGS